ncbi:(4Fe-4S)-binding protein [Candidatus Bathyarchaeota archaeon RBG_13_60_20]|jgi:MinD superfamily P-loop ATPase|nr:MAG: (4Fe-4S)-binding protein [Candidatus Bathyarchaeota archaeon RBG_13_60_20]
MKLVVASGKGGTGKTSISVNLALSTGAKQVIDCDVEEPNVHIFLKPENPRRKPVELLVPQINEKKCTHCRRCTEFCQYNALFVVGETAMVFPELCHSCGGCRLVCPEDAITEKPRRIGTITVAESHGMELVYGELDVGEALAVPVISAVKEQAVDDGLVILDAAPGAACLLVETVHGADFCLMVTEPTPFGLHDLQVATEVVKQLGVPLGVVVNFAGVGDRGVYGYCEREEIPVIMEIPYDRRIAELYSRGIPFTAEMTEWRSRFRELMETVEAMIA